MPDRPLLQRAMSAPLRLTDLVVGGLIGAAVVAWGGWEIARGADVSEEVLFSLVPSFGARQTPGDDALVLPSWVRLALGAGLAVAGGVVLAGVGQEARRRALGRTSAADTSERTRSIAALLFSVGTGAFFAIVGSVMALAAAGTIRSESGRPAEMPGFLAGIGAFIAVASLLLTYSAIHRWMGGPGVVRAGRRRGSRP